VAWNNSGMNNGGMSSTSANVAGASSFMTQAHHSREAAVSSMAPSRPEVQLTPPSNF
jgi:hypothetical protein